MKAGLLVAALLSLATPQVSWGTIEASLSGRDTISLSTPSGSQAQVSRAVTSKSQKIFGTAFAVPTAVALLIPPSGASERSPLARSDSPNVPCDGPPLAPRPPPHS